MGEGPVMPLRLDISLCSILPKSKTSAKLRVESRQFSMYVSDAELEIERFEKDFVLPLFRNVESDKSCSTRSIEGVYCIDGILNDKYKRFYSSSDSIPTDTDSGIFLRLSSADRDSDDSDSSIVVKNKFKENHGEYSDEDDEKDTKPSSLHSRRSQIRHLSSKRKSVKPSTNLSIHKTEDCVGMVTVNGCCYHCI
jgi:hypothetical protein